MRIAASIILLIGVSFWLYKSYFSTNEQSLKSIAIVSKDSTLSYKLADNSSVFLNKNSEIVYNEDYGHKKRELRLTGEAYFDVKHSAEVPFIVHAKDLIIKDIGTAFNVKAYKDSNIVEVYVESGEVLFYSNENPGLTLTKGETGIYDRTIKTFRKYTKAEANILSYKTHVLVFQDIKLADVIEKLNSIYNVKIKFESDNIKNCKITVSFDNEDIDSVLSIICETLGLKVSKKDSGYILEGNSCSGQ
jgi:ferric-dicitrate binding protein FerR (iron transport regulator)